MQSSEWACDTAELRTSADQQRDPGAGERAEGSTADPLGRGGHAPDAKYPPLRAIPGGRDDRPRPTQPEPLWREALGQQLRELRRLQAETLAETAGRAGVSPQYLSEIERGRKEPSSEMIAALAGALGTDLPGLLTRVAEELRIQRRPAARPPAPRASAAPTLLLLAA